MDADIFPKNANFLYLWNSDCGLVRGFFGLHINVEYDQEMDHRYSLMMHTHTHYSYLMKIFMLDRHGFENSINNNTMQAIHV